MISAKELRSGNYVFIKDKYDGNEVKQLCFNLQLELSTSPNGHFVRALHSDEITLSRISGIPLSNEVLIASGFDYNDGFREWSRGSFVLNMAGNGYIVQNTFGRVYHYLHEIQNLYFDLLGYEITYNHENAHQ